MQTHTNKQTNNEQQCSYFDVTASTGRHSAAPPSCRVCDLHVDLHFILFH